MDIHRAPASLAATNPCLCIDHKQNASVSAFPGEGHCSLLEGYNADSVILPVGDCFSGCGPLVQHGRDVVLDQVET